MLVAMILIMGREGGSQQKTAHGSSPKASEDATDQSPTPPISLQPERITLSGRHVFYEFPPGSCSGMKGILFLYHGCTRTALSFFYSPQGRDMMRTSLSAGLAVVAFEKQGSCWLTSLDLDVTVTAGNQWIEQYLVPHCGDDAGTRLPFFGFGASSGGSFVAEVASKSSGFKFASINVQIMIPHADISIPTVFTVMSRDGHTLHGVEQVSTELKAKGIPALTIKTHPKRVTFEYLMGRFKDDESFTEDIAQGIVSDLQKMGAIAEDGSLELDPRSLDIGSIFSYKSPNGAFGVSPVLWEMLSPSEKEDASTLWLVEELNVCYDQHEITASQFENVVGFFVAHA